MKEFILTHKWLSGIVVLILFVAMLFSCGGSKKTDTTAMQQTQPQVTQTQPQIIQQTPPVIVQAAPQQSNSGLSDMITGAMIGHMLFGGSNNSAATPVVIDRTVTVHAPPAPTPTAPVAPSVTPPAPVKPTVSGSRAAAAAYNSAPSRSSTPSYSVPSRSSSFSSSTSGSRRR